MGMRAYCLNLSMTNGRFSTACKMHLLFMNLKFKQNFYAFNRIKNGRGNLHEYSQFLIPKWPCSSHTKRWFPEASLCQPHVKPIHHYSMMKSAWPYSTAWPLSTNIFLIVPERSASISLRIFMASIMQTVSPSLTFVPTSTKGSAPGLAAR